MSNQHEQVHGNGAMTISIMTYNLKTLSIMIKKATLTITTLNILEEHCYAMCYLC
jgi:hypothetical protein